MTDPATLPYRPNVGAALFNRVGQILIARRAGHQASFTHPWQLPQGGIDAGEDPRTAVLRELGEEIGTTEAAIIGEIPDWITYDFPPDIAARLGNRHRGQRQRWFALRFTGTDAMIRLDADPNPEFIDWRWADLATIPALAVPFKRHIYERIARDFAAFATPQGD
ncbi:MULTISPECIES: RNA pyrophosphohydrolase [Acidiphilium]|jgi:putative (di)nucleoside polyphosphate hydrolase|uniref:RNA pyrophosphohydrolase n=1 Tax=Acidiphilium rubrum TaxID=526 RepID=A0A8G2FDB3_ACIRU|nr:MULTISPECIES: RNA pyrophosphohydrolase [Acidiphilium]MBW4036766.1 RNA pyrophosphohydrolase [Pseudomonadota bacterium]SIQ76817.1 putative (di)nucleoside polyphosphate hydrolase [Acidiphilium rubrum]